MRQAPDGSTPGLREGSPRVSLAFRKRYRVFGHSPCNRKEAIDALGVRKWVEN